MLNGGTWGKSNLMWIQLAKNQSLGLEPWILPFDAWTDLTSLRTMLKQAHILFCINLVAHLIETTGKDPSRLESQQQLQSPKIEPATELATEPATDPATEPA